MLFFMHQSQPLNDAEELALERTGKIVFVREYSFQRLQIHLPKVARSSMITTYFELILRIVDSQNFICWQNESFGIHSFSL